MKRALRTLACLAISLVLAAGTLVATAWLRSEAAIDRVRAAEAGALTLRRDAAEIERGRHLAATRGCSDCHGDDYAGRVLIEGSPMGRFDGANLTRLGDRDPAEIERAIRQGLRADGTSLMLMPTIDYAGLSDSDTAALIAFLQSLPAKGEATPAVAPGLMPRLLWLFGKFPLISHEQIEGRAIERRERTPAATAEYGAYVAQVCQGCHNPSFTGGPMAGAPPEAPPPANLTSHASGLAGWNEADFVKAMRSGERPDGRVLDPFMPWPTFARMTDDELAALWRYLSTLPPMPKGSRS
jgi:cytochrome c553